MLDDELRELYREVIVDHQKSPRNCRTLPQATHSAEGHNPLCGDQINVYLTMDDETIREVTFQGAGCAISTASASLMTEALRGKTRNEAERLFDQFRTSVTEEMVDGDARKELGKLCVLAGVRQFPVRVKCATLAWHTMRAALKQQESLVSTE